MCDGDKSNLAGAAGPDTPNGEAWRQLAELGLALLPSVITRLEHGIQFKSAGTPHARWLGVVYLCSFMLINTHG